MFGIRDLKKLSAIIIASACAVFVCALFLNYQRDLIGIREEITTPQGIVMYEAQVTSGKVVVGVSGGCLLLTTVVLLIFYVKHAVDIHSKELGILKALGYSDVHVAKYFWIFGLSVLIGTVLGYGGALCYMPGFYQVQNRLGQFPPMPWRFHLDIALALTLLPTGFFMLLAVVYAFFRLRRPVLTLFRGGQDIKRSRSVRETGDAPFLIDLRKNTLRSRKILVFFVGFSAFCFSAMTQMSMSMKTLASESMSTMILFIGLLLAWTTLWMSLTNMINANTKTIAMMKVFGYSSGECSRSLLGGYRPVSYIGFAIGTGYQYVLLRIMVDFVYAEYEEMPVYHFDVKALLISFVSFVVVYEIILFWYSTKIGRQSVKSIMLE